MTAPASAREAGAVRPGRIRAWAAPGRRDERGGAVSLWVVLMVPVSAFAAVVALAGPQRLAAESSVQEAADDLATFAVAWRDGHDMHEGPLPAFPPECAARDAQQVAELNTLESDINALNPTDASFASDLQVQQDALRVWFDEFNMAFHVEPQPTPAEDKQQLLDRFDEFVGKLQEWEDACRVLSEALVRDLGYLGIDMGSVRGFYSDSLSESPEGGLCNDPQHATRTACIDRNKTWTPEPQFQLPCWPSAQIVVQDAVHVAVAGDWQDAGWASAQVWPDGIPMAAESMGRLSQRRAPPATPPECDEQLVVFDDQGRPVWADGSPGPPSRTLAQSVRRTALSG